MKTQHTTGPWRTLPAKDYTYENGKALKVVATNPAHHSDYKFTAIVYGDMVDGRCESDAALISAAPDLLAALELLAQCAKSGPVMMSDAVGNVCRAAIAKARGE